MLDTETEGCYSSPALVGDTLFFGSDGLRNNHLFALNPADGSIRWKFQAQKQIFGTPAVVGGIVYFHSRDDHVYAVTADEGTLRWKTPAPSPQDEFSVFSDMTKSSPAVAGEGVFVGIGRDLARLDRATGRVVWRAKTGRKVDSSPLVVGNTVYVGSDDRKFYAFDASSGAKLWEYRTAGRVSATPSVGEGLVFIGSNDGHLYAFEPAE
jgi:outer membrane protein assembly factor BamB